MPLPSEDLKVLAYKQGTIFGTPATASGAQLLRRISFALTPGKETFQSDETEPTLQLSDFRHGKRMATAQLNGRFSCGTYKDFLQAAVKQDWQVAPTTGAIITVTAAVSVAPAGTFTRSAGSYITDGFRVGQIVQWTGWTVATANNSRYMVITALTSNVMTGIFLDGTAVVAKAAGDTVTCVLVGRQTWVPQSGHTRKFFDFEEWHPDMDIPQSELGVSMVMQNLNFNFDPKGNTGIDFQMAGATMNFQGSQYFTSPTAVTTSGLHGGIDGKLYLGGTLIADVLGLQLQMALGNQLADATFGSRQSTDFFPDKILPTGSITLYFRDGTLRDGFWNEAPLSLVASTRAGPGAQAETFGLVIPLMKFASATKGVQGRGVTRQYNFTAYNNKTGTGADQTSIAFQDTLAP
jgi:hypothetical protein